MVRKRDDGRWEGRIVVGHKENGDFIWYDFFYTELTTGLRLGEICGLMWTDFDDRAGMLHICRTLHRERGSRLVAEDTC